MLGRPGRASRQASAKRRAFPPIILNGTHRLPERMSQRAAANISHSTSTRLERPGRVVARLRWAGLGLAAFTGFLLILLATRLGLGLRDDSFAFVTAAESLSAGTGLGRWASDGTFRPLTHFPPFYSVFLAVLDQLGGGILPAARWAHATLFGLTIILVGLMIYDTTESSMAMWIGAGAVASSRTTLELFTWAQSEPLYIVLGLAGLLLLGRQLRTPRHWKLLVGSSLCLSLAFLTRYAGISLILAGILVWANSGRTAAAQHRWKQVLAVGIMLAPTSIFMVRNALLLGNLIDRPLPTWHPPGAEAWTGAALTIFQWILPPEWGRAIPRGLLLPILAAGAIPCFLLIRPVLRVRPFSTATVRQAAPGTLWLLGCHVVVYLFLVVGTVLWIDRLTPLNSRILSPIFFSLLILLVASLELRLRRMPSARKIAVIAFSLLLLAFQGGEGLQWTREIRWTGLGLASHGWRSSPTIRHIRQLPDITIYTNDLPALYFLAGRAAFSVPSPYDPASGRASADYEAALFEMQTRIHKEGGLLILFGLDPQSRLGPVHFGDLTEGLSLLEVFRDGLVFGAMTEEGSSPAGSGLSATECVHSMQASHAARPARDLRHPRRGTIRTPFPP